VLIFTIHAFLNRKREKQSEGHELSGRTACASAAAEARSTRQLQKTARSRAPKVVSCKRLLAGAAVSF